MRKLSKKTEELREIALATLNRYGASHEETIQASKAFNEAKNKEFNKDFDKIWKILWKEDKSEYGMADTLRECIDDELYRWQEDAYIYKSDLFYPLRDFVNYDYVCVTEKGLNVKDSNHSDIAKILDKWVTPEVAIKVWESFH